MSRVFHRNFLLLGAACSRRYARGTRVYTYLKRVATPSAQATARKRSKKNVTWQSSFLEGLTNMNLGDEHMTDETRDIYRAKVAERQAAEDALVQQRVEAASDYVGTRVETNR